MSERMFIFPLFGVFIAERVRLSFVNTTKVLYNLLLFVHSSVTIGKLRNSDMGFFNRKTFLYEGYISIFEGPRKQKVMYWLSVYSNVFNDKNTPDVIQG